MKKLNIKKYMNIGDITALCLILIAVPFSIPMFLIIMPLYIVYLGIEKFITYIKNHI